MIATFHFYICFRAFSELQYGRNGCPAKKIVTRFARATVTKSFQRTPGNISSTGPRKASQTPDLQLESEKVRVALSSHINSRASRFLESLIFVKRTRNIVVKN